MQTTKSASGAFAQVLAAGIMAVFLGACASPYPPAPEAAYSPDYSYVIGPGDTVNVFVWRNPELSGSFAVRPDGKITTHLVEDVPVAGKTPTAVARELEQILSKYIRDPVVTVIMGGGKGPFSEQIRILGEAAKPQALSYVQKMTLVDVMIAVGGITDFADGNRAILLRTSENNAMYNVRLKDLVKKADLSANVDMKPGDILIIPQSWF